MNTGATPAGLVRHRLVVEADAHPNLLLRLLEPFAVSNVLPTRIRMDGPADGVVAQADPGLMRAEIAFVASAELAERLWSRIDVMVPVRNSHLVSSTSGGAVASA